MFWRLLALVITASMWTGRRRSSTPTWYGGYITTDSVTDKTPAGDGSVSAASLAVVKDDDEGSGCDECGCEILPVRDGWGSKETPKDLKFSDELSKENVGIWLS
ncbi:hypothetical protein PoB_004308900 [Plakobranchus ocellatus]|uniref:Secreted protein n=1 Tax=Plakobranchus ocellatus TaxID=259542 RepID=A0AAV4BCR2_9GAST|nr:hypothetical protein PoB_004308900 [Plakobranchus ocellatus]